MSRYQIVALFGESASGKDTIQKYMVSNMGAHGIVSCTTRGKRDYEEEGKDYYLFPTYENIKDITALLRLVDSLEDNFKKLTRSLYLQGKTELTDEDLAIILSLPPESQKDFSFDEILQIIITENKGLNLKRKINF